MATQRCHVRDHVTYCDAVADQIAAMADGVRGADFTARVPTCPDWSLADLVEHTGAVHRWVTSMVDGLATRRGRFADLLLDLPTSPAGWPDWLLTGGVALDASLRAADPDAAMWAWGEDQHVRFWSRRMLHETAVHRGDAELARGAVPAMDATVAVDGIDELLDNLPTAVYFAPRVAELTGTGQRIGLRATDRRVTWTIHLGETGYTWDHDDADADVLVGAAAADLLQLMWGRHALDDPRLNVDGDAALMADWLTKSAL